MKTLIAGSRSIDDSKKIIDVIEEACENGLEITEVVSGGAKGVDRVAEQWGKNNDVKVSIYPYEDFTGEEYNKPAPLVRNDKMIEYAEQAIIVWDGESSGTQYVIENLKDTDMELFLRRTDTRNITDF